MSSTTAETTASTIPAPEQDLADEVIALVRHWLHEAEKFPVDAAAQRLAGVLKDPGGLDFTVGFVDGVIRPEDLTVAGRNLAALAPRVPAFLPWHMRAAVRVGGLMAPALPQLVIPVARRVLRNMVGHLIVDATDSRLGPAIANIRRGGVDLNINLLGEAVLGEREAKRRLEGTLALLERDDVDYVSIKESATVAPHSPWAFDDAVAHVVDKLTPLFRLANSFTPAKFINLDMEEYKDLGMTLAVFKGILDKPEFANLEAGIVLQAYLPDTLAALMELQEWAAARRAGGGAAIKVRIVKGANLPMEQVQASLTGWPLATWGSKQDTDTNYKRLVNYALTAEHLANVHIGVAGHNLFDVAYAWLLAQRRGVDAGTGRLDFEMLLGMATGQAEAVRRDVGSLLLYTPVVHPGEFDVAIAYLIRRLEEGASAENFMSAVFELSASEKLFTREKERFLASVAELDTAVPPGNRVQDRNRPAGLAQDGAQAAAPEGFANTPDTDPALAANRLWGADILARIPGSTVGTKLVADATVTDRGELERLVGDAVDHGAAWGALTGAERAAVLHRAGEVLESRRGELLEVMASETGKTLDQGDPEVSEAVDFAHYYAERAKELDAVDGATFVPAKLTVVAPPWNFPVAIPAGSTLAALAAGSAVVVKPAPQARRCGSLMVQALWDAGVPREVLALMHLGEDELGQALISHPAVDRVILTGGYETAELFRSFRTDLPLLAETSGKNAIIVTPSADLDLAARDVAASAFGHAGQKCSAASLVVMVGSVAQSARFHNQLLDAVTSLAVGHPESAASQMGPVIEPAAGKLLGALTTLGAGEAWALEPRQLDETGRLWSPGIRTGVVPGSEFHLTEYFGPVLGVMHAETLAEAISWINAIDYGLTSGLHSLDTAEIALWLDTVQAGNLYVNRGITGAIVQRQPFGGWKKSAVGAGTKAGGPNYLLGLGSWQSTAATATHPLGDAARKVLSAASFLPAEEKAFLTRSLHSDAEAWTAEFGVARDISALAPERNLFRYLPVNPLVRLADGGSEAQLLRVLAAGMVAGATPEVSCGVDLPSGVKALLLSLRITLWLEDDDAWLARARDFGAGRIRLIGGDAAALHAATAGRPDVAVYSGDVTEAGRVEMLPFLHEQAISITAHRFGTPNHLTDGLI